MRYSDRVSRRIFLRGGAALAGSALLPISGKAQTNEPISADSVEAYWKKIKEDLLPIVDKLKTENSLEKIDHSLIANCIAPVIRESNEFAQEAGITYSPYIIITYPEENIMLVVDRKNLALAAYTGLDMTNIKLLDKHIPPTSSDILSVSPSNRAGTYSLFPKKNITPDVIYDGAEKFVRENYEMLKQHLNEDKSPPR